MMKGIDIISGFNVKSASPIDTRMVAETREEMNSIENMFEGLIVVCLEDKKIYLYLNGKFEEYSGSVSNNTALTTVLKKYLSLLTHWLDLAPINSKYSEIS